MRVFVVRWLAISTAAARDNLRSLGAVIGTAIFLCFVLFVYSSLWQAVAESRSWTLAPGVLVWYLALTELPVMSPTRIPRAIETDIKAGAFALYLVRPTGYFRHKLAEACGQMAVRFSVLAGVGIVASWLVTGALPVSPVIFISAICLAFIGSVIAVIHLLTIGALAIWLGESVPLFWLWQKLLFVLGGMMIPLHLYPPLLKDFALVSPFAAMLYAPASLLFEPTISHGLSVVGQQLFWLVLSLLVLALVVSRGVKFAVAQGRG